MAGRTASEQFMLRLPPGMRERIAEAAKTNMRTKNAEIVARLNASFDQDTDNMLTVLGEMLRSFSKMAPDDLAVLMEKTRRSGMLPPLPPVPGKE